MVRVTAPGGAVEACAGDLFGILAGYAAHSARGYCNEVNDRDDCARDPEALPDPLR
jgi:hypothetical protein